MTLDLPALEERLREKAEYYGTAELTLRNETVFELLRLAKAADELGYYLHSALPETECNKTYCDAGDKCACWRSHAQEALDGWEKE